MRNIFSSEYGVFIEKEGNDKFIVSDNVGILGIKRKVVEGGENEFVVQVELRNIGEEDVLVKSMVVA